MKIYRNKPQNFEGQLNQKNDLLFVSGNYDFLTSDNNIIIINYCLHNEIVLYLQSKNLSYTRIGAWVNHYCLAVVFITSIINTKVWMDGCVTRSRKKAEQIWMKFGTQIVFYLYEYINHFIYVTIKKIES